MIFLKQFKLLDNNEEYYLKSGDTRTIYNNYYPLGIFPKKEFKEIEFDKITIFYGGNGSGKSTLLNLIADKLNAKRKSNIDNGSLFSLYVNACEYSKSFENPIEISIISSDDIFDYLLDVRAINGSVNRLKNQMSKEYLEHKFNEDNSNINNYEEVKNSVNAKRETMSKYVRDRLINNNIILQSNGESALMFWEKEINQDSIYLLDEPENSLSAENQLKLKKFIEDSVRFYNCQFIISTHSPFLLGLNDALIYDLDETPVKVKKFNELKNIKIYYEFFKERENEFK